MPSDLEEEQVIFHSFMNKVYTMTVQDYLRPVFGLVYRAAITRILHALGNRVSYQHEKILDR